MQGSWKVSSSFTLGKSRTVCLSAHQLVMSGDKPLRAYIWRKLEVCPRSRLATNWRYSSIGAKGTTSQRELKQLSSNLTSVLLHTLATSINCLQRIPLYFYRLQSYNPSTHVCCARTISPKPARCCGSASYNPNTHTCCGGRVLSTAGITSPGCCGSTVYDRNQKVKKVL